MKIPWGISLTGWGGLGFYRGCMDYGHSSAKYEFPHLYTQQCLYGISGTICYLNPVLLFIFIPKEMYRFEVVVRGMEQEKLSDKYNRII
jgi:hypothetical protein